MAEDNPTEDSTTDRITDSVMGEMDEEDNPTEGSTTDRITDAVVGEMDDGEEEEGE